MDKGSEEENLVDDSLTPQISWSDRYKMAMDFLYGDSDIPPDFEKTFALLLEEAEDGNALAMYDLGRMFADGLGREIDMEQAQSWYKKALDAFLKAEPTPYIEYRIGKMYAAGLGTEQDYMQAASWFREAAEQNNKYAMYSLAGLYLKGQGVEQDAVKARELYRKAAQKGFPYAVYELAKMYQDGIGGEKDSQTAEDYFSQALFGFRSMEKESHDDKLQYRIGWMLLHGVGAKKDEAAAQGWFEKASLLGNPQAQYQLAKMIFADPTSSPDEKAGAINQLVRSAEAGNQHAQYVLGKLFLLGQEVERDRETAVYWLTLSAGQGNLYAQYFLIHLNDFRDHLLVQGTTNLLRHLGNIFREQVPPSSQGIHVKVDSKLKRKIQEKKAAQGHKRDDHEPTMT